MRIVGDFHLHSRYSRATSSQLDLDLLARWAGYKGITLLGTGDCTHPLWMAELKQKLKPTSKGLYEYQGTLFLPTAEVNNNFVSGGKGKRIHNVLFFPSIEAAEAVNKRLARYGDLMSDGRPTLNLSAADMVKLVLDVSPEALIVPAHVWTPHFSVFGANSGFDTVEECFGDQAKEIFCLETGLSSDPAMNWRLSRLDRYTLISNSDSHSASRLGREANVFDCEPGYAEIIAALKTGDRGRFLYTIEFFPEEGKYHYDGHRACKARLSPAEAAERQGRCPVCGRKVTVGVMHRVEALADRGGTLLAAEAERPSDRHSATTPMVVASEVPRRGGDAADRLEGSAPSEGQEAHRRIPFRNMIPLDQIIADARGVGAGSKAVEQEYLDLVQRVGTELEILLDIPEDQLRKALSPKVAEGVLRVRAGQVEIEPGYDGEYGRVKIFQGNEDHQPAEKQLSLF